MEITEVRVKLVPSQGDKLRAFCSITIDDNFVIRDLKIIEGARGPFVAMPSRKLMERCARCGGKNQCRAKFCNDCGLRLPGNGALNDPASRLKLHSDIAHPINSRCRELIQKCILEEYSEELARARDPSYQPQDLDELDDDGWRDAVGPTTDSALANGPGLALPARAEDAEDNFGAGLFS